MGLHLVEADGMSPAAAPAPSSPPGPVERVVALALAAILVVLVLVLADLGHAAAASPAAPFDFENPLLFAQSGQCVEIVDESLPEESQRLVVSSLGPVLRPYRGPAKIDGWASAIWKDPREFPPYLVCERRNSSSAPPVAPGSPPPRPDPLVFPLNNFGLPLEAPCVLRSIRPATVRWQGRTRSAYEVDLMRYVSVEGPWIAWMAKDVPVLGTMKREYPSRGAPGTNAQVFLVPPDCR